MALILAVDPESVHGEALERLARDLPGHQMVTATSCVGAHAEIDRRAPDLLLLPLLLPESEEKELRAHLESRPSSGQPRILTIPLLSEGDTADHTSFTALVRQHLPPPNEAEAADAERRARVVAAARQAAEWIRSRRSSWNDPAAVAAPAPPAAGQAPRAATPPSATPPSATAAAAPPPPPRPTTAPAPRSAHGAGSAPPPPIATAAAKAVPAPAPPSPQKPAAAGPRIDRPLFAEFEEAAAASPGAASRAAEIARAAAGPLRRWLPRAAGLVLLVAVLVTVGVEGRTYWLKAMDAARNGEVVLESVPEAAQVAIDGKAAGTTPLTMRLTAGSHVVEFRRRNAARTKEIVVARGGHTMERMDWTRKPTGSLHVSTLPAGAHVVVDGADLGVTPITLDQIEIGPHAVQLRTDQGVVERSVTIRANQTAQLSESIVDGWVTVYSPFDITITDGTRPIRLDDRNQMMLSAGPHDLRFANRALAYEETRHLDVQPGSAMTISIVPPHSTLSVTASEPAEVYVDGALIGDTPVAGHPVDLGTRNVLVKGPNGDQRRLTLTVTTRPASLNIDFSKPTSGEM